MISHCVICNIMLESVNDNKKPFQPYGGGEIKLEFCYGSTKFDNNFGVTRYTGYICDACALPLVNKMKELYE